MVRRNHLKFLTHVLIIKGLYFALSFMLCLKPFGFTGLFLPHEVTRVANKGTIHVNQ